MKQLHQLVIWRKIIRINKTVYYNEMHGLWTRQTVYIEGLTQHCLNLY